MLDWHYVAVVSCLIGYGVGLWWRGRREASEIGLYRRLWSDASRYAKSLHEENESLRDRWNRTAQAAKEQADERVALREQNRALAERVAAQSELLGRVDEGKRACRARHRDRVLKVIEGWRRDRERAIEAERRLRAVRSLVYVADGEAHVTEIRPEPHKFKVGDRAYVRLDGIWQPGDVFQVFADGSVELKLDSGWNVMTAEARTYEEFGVSLRSSA